MVKDGLEMKRFVEVSESKTKKTSFYLLNLSYEYVFSSCFSVLLCSSFLYLTHEINCYSENVIIIQIKELADYSGGIVLIFF